MCLVQVSVPASTPSIERDKEVHARGDCTHALMDPYHLEQMLYPQVCAQHLEALSQGQNSEMYQEVSGTYLRISTW